MTLPDELSHTHTHTHMHTYRYLTPSEAYTRLWLSPQRANAIKQPKVTFIFLCNIIILHADKTLKAKAPKGITIKRAHIHIDMYPYTRTYTQTRGYLELEKRKLNWRKSFCALCSFVFLHFACQIKSLGVPHPQPTTHPHSSTPPHASLGIYLFFFAYWKPQSSSNTTKINSLLRQHMLPAH